MRAWLQKLRAGFGNLAPRERILVSVVGLLLGIAVLTFGIVMPLLEAGTSVEARVARAEQQLEIMKRMRRDFDDVNQRLTSVEARIQKGERGNLRTTLESLAKKATVKIESMEPQASPANDRYRETKVEVGLKQVSLSQTVRYLHEIESMDQVLSIKTLRIRNRTDKSNLLDVNFTVSSFEPL